MSDDVDILQTIADQNAAADAADNPEPVAAGGADTGGADTPEWQTRFNDPNDLYKSFRHAETAMTQANQQRADLERRIAEYEAQQAEPQEDPYAAFGGVPPMPEDLAQLAAHDPGQAYYYALVNPQQFGWQAEQIQNDLYMQWFMQNPQAAMDYRLEMMVGQRMQQQQAELAPVFNNLTEQMTSATQQWAQTSLPEWGTFAGAVQAELGKNANYYKSLAGERPSPDSLREVVTQAYSRVRFEQMQAQPQTPPPAAAPAAPAANTRTQNRNTATPADASYDEALRKMIMESQG
jgi:hypothetical protein